MSYTWLGSSVSEVRYYPPLQLPTATMSHCVYLSNAVMRPNSTKSPVKQVRALFIHHLVKPLPNKDN